MVTGTVLPSLSDFFQVLLDSEIMRDNRYLCLLRGINVGGKNIIPMADLKSCFENMGFTGVSTFIQSGNVLFNSDKPDISSLTSKTEQALSAQFRYNSSVVIVPHNQLKTVIEKAPEGFGKEPDKFSYGVIFLKEPLTPDELLEKVRTREGVDRTYAGETVLYFSRLISRASQSYLSRLISLPEYQYITIRNWNTSTRLLKLMEKQ